MSDLTPMYELFYNTEAERDAARADFEAKGRRCANIRYLNLNYQHGLYVERKWSIGMAEYYYNEVKDLLNQAREYRSVNLGGWCW